MESFFNILVLDIFLSRMEIEVFVLKCNPSKCSWGISKVNMTFTLSKKKSSLKRIVTCLCITVLWNKKIIYILKRHLSSSHLESSLLTKTIHYLFLHLVSLLGTRRNRNTQKLNRLSKFAWEGTNVAHCLYAILAWNFCILVILMLTPTKVAFIEVILGSKHHDMNFYMH